MFSCKLKAPLKIRSFILPGLQVFILLSIACSLQGQSSPDSASTAFRKSRWLIGMSGTISSGTVRSDSLSASGFSAEYSLNISGSKFVRDRLAIGAILDGYRNKPLSVERETESLFLGPLVTYYLSKSPVGSIFLQGAPGYSRYREERVFDSGSQRVKEEVDGQGVGLLSTFGYSIVIKDTVGFDLGFTFLTSWIWADREASPPAVSIAENFRTGNFAFSFGFKVLL